ncbi:hypothetical protein HW450_06715 [Corynebacterium hindlerae]|uniref:Uncharacterized protein n=1 Tax=Corynebacterium hindlerae TaxID=699041 RepID=A0A7G5FBU3_9CORY|nr:hypothetical protein [Corynebacterium hindlerae]QMV84084.1 hypothetical protein HW450_06715 [Corynebacterium hindlerae]
MVWNHGNTPREKLEEKAERNKKILKCRRLGMSNQEIGDKFNLDQSTVFRIVQKHLRDIPKEEADELRQLELERLDIATRGIMPKVLKGDAQAVNALVKVADHRAKLVGLYQLDATDDGSEVGKAFVELLDSVKNAVSGADDSNIQQ